MRLDDHKAPLAERVQVANELGKATKGDVRAIDALLRGLDAPAEELREAVRTSLRRLGAGSVLAARALDEDAPAGKRRSAIRALRGLNSASAYPALARLVESPLQGLRAEAALALTGGGANVAERGLAQALNDSSAEVRYYAAVALGGLTTRTAKKAILERAAIERDFAVIDALGQAIARQAR